MPITVYSEKEYRQLQLELTNANKALRGLELLRPQWAMGYTSDSMAAQASSGALQHVYNALEVTNQTECMGKLIHLVSFYEIHAAK